MDVTEVSIVHHMALVLLLLWALATLGWHHPLMFFGAFLYLLMVNEHNTLKLRKRIQYEERKSANQRRLLSDSESVRWLNHAMEKIWPVCMERIASEQFLLPIIPWFLDKFKPWTVEKAVFEAFYLGRNPPMFTEMRVLPESADDDHLVLELGMVFLSADDMNATLSVQLNKALGFGMWTKMHITGMHVEGKVLVGVKFIRHWPFIGRVRACFVEPPYFQMTVKPLFNHGIDVTELPGISGWLDKLLSVAFEQTLVEPNMLVVDVEKFVSAPTESCFTIQEKQTIAFAKVEILEAAELKPSDLNGLADPYVMGHMGSHYFKTKIQRKTLAPKWLEEFKLPITSWEAPNVLILEVRDKDPIFDDTLGDCSINIADLRGGQRHDMWLPLRNVKKGRLHLAVAVIEDESEKGEKNFDGHEEISTMTETKIPKSIPMAHDYDSDASVGEDRKVADEFEPINIEGQRQTGIWIHRPGSEDFRSWEPRKGRARQPGTEVHCEDNRRTSSPQSVVNGHHNTTSNAENATGDDVSGRRTIWSGLLKIGSKSHKTSKNKSRREHEEEASPKGTSTAEGVGDERTALKLAVDDTCMDNTCGLKADQKGFNNEKVEGEKLGKGHGKGEE